MPNTILHTHELLSAKLTSLHQKYPVHPTTLGKLLHFNTGSSYVHGTMQECLVPPYIPKEVTQV
jgi:hypothetical protein